MNRPPANDPRDTDYSRLVEQVDGIAAKQNDTAVILERLKNYLADHDRRIGALENQPASSRAAVNVYAQVAIAAMAAAALLMSIMTHVSLH